MALNLGSNSVVKILWWSSFARIVCGSAEEILVLKVGGYSTKSLNLDMSLPKRIFWRAIWVYMDLLDYWGATVLQKRLKDNKGVCFFREGCFCHGNHEDLLKNCLQEHTKKQTKPDKKNTKKHMFWWKNTTRENWPPTHIRMIIRVEYIIAPMRAFLWKLLTLVVCFYHFRKGRVIRDHIQFLTVVSKKWWELKGASSAKTAKKWVMGL